MNEDICAFWQGAFLGALITLIILLFFSIIGNYGFTAKQKLELIQIVKEYKS